VRDDRPDDPLERWLTRARGFLRRSSARCRAGSRNPGGFSGAATLQEEGFGYRQLSISLGATLALGAWVTHSGCVGDLEAGPFRGRTLASSRKCSGR
jgi:hypothetical protein